MGIVKGLDIGKRAIMAQTEAIKVAGQNISNVNVPGYSRRKIELRSMIYSDEDRISALSARRVRDEFIDYHIRVRNHALGDWDMRSQLYHQIEGVFLEPSEHGFNNALANFWNSWEDLANNPENMAPRSVVAQHGVVVAKSINDLDSQLRDLRQVSNSYIENRVAQINNITVRIADINGRIVSMEASGEEASEIRDSRDLLIEQMSRLVNTSSVERETGSITLFIGGQTIVDDEQVIELGIKKLPNDGMMVSHVVWSDDENSVNINGGELAGLISIRDDIIPGILNEIDQLASTLIGEVNAIHSGGFGSEGSTGVDFFTGTDASDISVSDVILGDVKTVAASESGEPGGNGVALDIAALANENIAPGNMNLGIYYSNICATLGTQSQSASMMRENSEMLLDQLEERRESVSGVSLDEEAADLIKFQHAYEAAAHYLSVVDELIGTLLNIA